MEWMNGDSQKVKKHLANLFADFTVKLIGSFPEMHVFLLLWRSIVKKKKKKAFPLNSAGIPSAHVRHLTRVVNVWSGCVQQS